MTIYDAARPFRDAFDYDPGHSDLDNEQPIHITVTLGNWRRLNMALREDTKRDAEQAALWRDLPLLHQMDLMLIFGGAESGQILLSKLKEWIERKRSQKEKS